MQKKEVDEYHGMMRKTLPIARQLAQKTNPALPSVDDDSPLMHAFIDRCLHLAGVVDPIVEDPKYRMVTKSALKTLSHEKCLPKEPKSDCYNKRSHEDMIHKSRYILTTLPDVVEEAASSSAASS